MSDDGKSTTHTTRAAAKSTISDADWNEATNEWINSSLRNSAMSNSTEAWNHLMASLPEFRKILEGKI